MAGGEGFGAVSFESTVGTVHDVSVNIAVYPLTRELSLNSSRFCIYMFFESLQ